MTIAKLFALNANAINYYLFTLSLGRCNERCNSFDDLFAMIFDLSDRLCVPNKTKKVNVKMFCIIKGMNESKTLIKQSSCGFRCRIDGKKCNSKQK